MRTLALLSACLFALAMGRAAPAQGAEDLPTLLERLASEDVTIAYEAYRALLTRRTPEALPLLAEVLPRCSRVGQSYGWSFLLGYPPADVGRLARRFAAEGPPYLRASAGAWLVRQGEPKAAAGVVLALAAAGEDPIDVSSVLGAIHGVKDPAVQAAVRALVRPETATMVLGAALGHLLGVTDEAARAPARALLEADPGSKALGAAFLWRMGEEGSATLLAEALASREVPYDAFVRLPVLFAGGGRLPEAVREALRGLLADPPSDYALPVLVRLVGDHPDPRAVPALKALLERDDETGKAAFDALAKIPGAFGPEDVRSLLESGSEARRVAAAEALRRGDDGVGLSTVVEILRTGTSARAEAARVLGGFRVRGAVEPLLDALLDADATVRAQALTSLGLVLTHLFPYRRLDLGATGYVATGERAAREAAVATMRAWWRAHEGGAW